MEWLVDSIEEIFNVLFEDAGLVHVDGSDVVLNDIGVRGAQLLEEISSDLGVD